MLPFLSSLWATVAPLVTLVMPAHWNLPHQKIWDIIRMSIMSVFTSIPWQSSLVLMWQPTRAFNLYNCSCVSFPLTVKLWATFDVSKLMAHCFARNLNLSMILSLTWFHVFIVAAFLPVRNLLIMICGTIGPCYSPLNQTQPAEENN